MRRESLVGEVQPWLCLLAVAGAAIINGPSGGLDGVGVGKTAAVALMALAAGVAAALGAVRQRAIEVPRHPAVLVAATFAIVLLVRALLSDQVGLALHGPLGRANGAVLYLACATLFVVAVARSEPRVWSLLGRGLVVVAAVVALAAIDEATVRLGPNWAERPGVAGTLGNANFLASWGGASLAVIAAVVADTRLHRGWRVAAVVTGVLMVVAVAMSGSLQAVFVVGAVAAVLLLVWTSERLSPARWRLLAGAAAVGGVTLAALTALGSTGAGPLARIGEQVGVRLRAEYWRAAVEMVREAPLLGVDPGRYIDHYRASRTEAAAAAVELTSSSDSAHNVPLHLAAEAGLPIALLWVAFAGLVTWALWRGLVARTGQERFWLGAIGAAWVAYLIQSLISIDVAPMAVLGWVLAGLIVGATRPGTARFGRPPATPGKSKSKGPRAAPPATTAPQLVASGAIVLVSLAAAWSLTQPYRADAAAARGDIDRQQTPDGRTATSPAVEQAPYESRYLVHLGQRLGGAGDLSRAEWVFQRATDVNPRSFEAHLNAARLAAREDELDTALERYARARELDPHHPELAVEMARVHREAGDDDRARELLAEALEVDPDHDEAQVLLDEL